MKFMCYFSLGLLYKPQLYYRIQSYSLPIKRIQNISKTCTTVFSYKDQKDGLI